MENEEYKQSLIEKLQEEVTEFLKDNNIQELCDILEVVEALARLLGYSEHEIKRTKDEKAKKNGAFRNRVFLEKVIIAD